MSESAYKIELRPGAARDIRRLDKSTQIKIVGAIERLSAEPRPSGVKKLAGEDKLYRIKIGKDHRVVYQIEDNLLIVLVLAAGNRKDIYRSLTSRQGG
jgi:mRNA interferase RelE/StbE